MSDGRYKIVQKIDAGGMAEVYKGIQTSVQGIEKLVAIKRVLPHLVKNAQFIEMFLDEARVSMYLSHANIAQVFDVGQSGDTYFIVMEFIEGVNLKSIVEHMKLSNRKMPIEQAIYIAIQMCEGLAYAHELRNPVSGKPLNIVHRDISPPNVLISRRGEVKLVDFGLAKAASQAIKTDQGVVKGKFSYLSPEAAQGQNVDLRTDVFAVGIVLWELLSGKRLFYGDTDFQTVEQVRRAQIPSLTQLHPQVTPEFEEILMTALARDIERRYQTARDLGDALNQYLFSRGLKVGSSDIARLVEESLSHRAARAVREEPSLINDMIQEELVKFSSINNNKNSSKQPALSADNLIDPRDWDFLSAQSTPAVSKPQTQPQVPILQSGGLADILEPERSSAPLPPSTVGEEEEQEASSSRYLMIAMGLLLLLAGVGGYAYLNGWIGSKFVSETSLFVWLP